MEGYDHRKIEKKWQEKWAADGAYIVPETKDGAENRYVLVEFAYPSGNLHVGHWYAFSVPDMYARYLRMKGYNVLYPFGFDAFGLPAENAAIKRGLKPRAWTYDNIAYMRDQLKSMGTMFDWSREVITSDPEYYKWTQWLFVQLFNNGLAYQAKTSVNWCPSCKTVLANEQVVAGRCERCESEVEQKELVQWNVKITDYADRLIDDLDALDWPEAIKDAQRNWIGRSEGYEIDFKLSTGQVVTVFTTRPDTLYGTTYMVLAPEHALVSELLNVVSNRVAVEQYIAETKKKSERERTGEGASKEKTGVPLEGVRATNPANGEQIPVWIADYVLAGYGTGVVMAVPAHDERDFEFAAAHGLPVKQVVAPSMIDTTNPPREGKQNTFRRMVLVVVYDPKTDRYLTLTWPKQGWVSYITGGLEENEDAVAAGAREVFEETGYKHIRFVRMLGFSEAHFFAEHKDVNRRVHAQHLLFELVDDEQDEVSPDEKALHEPRWLSSRELSRTRMQHAEHELLLERLRGGASAYTGHGVLVDSGEWSWRDSRDVGVALAEAAGGRKKTVYRLRDWSVSRQRYWGCPIPIIHCGDCGAVPVPDEQLPVVLPDIEDFLPAGDGRSPLAKVSEWVNVSCTKCGKPAARETDTLDTFVDSSWYFLRYLDSKNDSVFSSREKQERWMPVSMYSGGAEHTTMHLLYSRFFQKALFDIGLVTVSEPYARRTNRGLILGPDGNKMSKSKGNVIDPDDVVVRLGADTVRVYLAFIGPYNEVGAYPWSIDGIAGVRRFLEKFVRIANTVREGPPNEDLDRLIHQSIRKIEDSIARLAFNTGVSALMILARGIEEGDGITPQQYGIAVRLLAPFAPHLAEELWRDTLGNANSVHAAAWPIADPKRARAREYTIAVQVNGKVRAKITISAEADEDEVRTAALAHENVQKWLGGKKPQKIIYVPGRLVSIVAHNPSRPSLREA